MNIYFITGASKGLGLALCKQLIEKDAVKIYAFSRSNSEPLQNLIDKGSEKLQHISLDLNTPELAVSLFQDTMQKAPLTEAKQIVLINNAGAIDPIAPMDELEYHSLMQCLNVNLVTPALLSSAFIKVTQNLKMDRRIFNVSSGAGRNPIGSWGPYCMAKSGMDMFSRVIAKEQSSEGILCMSFGPGIMDTGMQETIRSTQSDKFADLSRFIAFKEDGLLLDAQTVSDVICKLLDDQHAFEQGALTNVKDYL